MTRSDAPPTQMACCCFCLEYCKFPTEVFKSELISKNQHGGILTDDLLAEKIGYIGTTEDCSKGIIN
jgi:hypothetical protein